MCCRWWDELRSQQQALEWLAAAFPQVPTLWLEQLAAACGRVASGDSAGLMCALPWCSVLLVPRQNMSHVFYTLVIHLVFMSTSL